MLRFASASTPGSNRLAPARRAASMSMVPTTRSSEELIGSSTTRIRRLCEGSMPLDARRSRQSLQCASRSSGSQPKWQPSTTECSGRSLASARTAVDLPVPFSPRMSTPPIVGTTALRIRASFIDSCPTIPVKGKTWRSSTMLTASEYGPSPPPAGTTGLAWDQTLDQVSFLDQLFCRLLDPLFGVVIVLQSLDDLPPHAVGGHREGELKALGYPVLALADHRQRSPVAPGRGRPDAVHRVDNRVR